MAEYYYCPNCGAILNEQEGFDPAQREWTCRVCSKQLMDSSVYDGTRFKGVAWFCDECGALLNRQKGFSDLFDEWKCVKCGHINEISENAIVESSGAMTSRFSKNQIEYMESLGLNYDFDNLTDDQYISRECN